MAKKVDLTPEKELIIGLIVSDEFIAKISPILSVKYLKTEGAKIIANWCLEYYREYSKAPGQYIQDLFQQRSKTLREEDADAIERILRNVSSDYALKEKYNVAYVVDKAELYIRERRVEILVDTATTEVKRGRVDKAETSILSYNKVSLQVKGDTNLWTDSSIIGKIFDKDRRELFSMPGILGEMMGPFRRDNLYAYAGVAKRGKTHWLADTALRASFGHCNTVFFSLEMADEEIADLLLNTYANKPNQDLTVRMPSFTEDNYITYREEELAAASVKDYTRWQKFGNIVGAPLHRFTYQPGEMTIQDMKNDLLNLEYYYGIIPDVVVVDYADIIGSKGQDQRDKINTIWMGLKALAKEYHCVVVTATHLNSDALTKDGGAVNVGEDRRKLNHVAGLWVLNQSPEEQKAWVMRLKTAVNRFGKYNSLDEVACLYQYEVGRTYIDSRWAKDIPEDAIEKEKK